MQLFPAPEETLVGTAQAIREGRLTCTDVVKRCLRQIDEWEPRVKAWVKVNKVGALAEAKVLDKEAKSGKFRGPLHGIPLGIKDIIDVAGYVTGCGSKKLSQGEPAAVDAAVVRKLRQAGAIILGKTVTTAYAYFDPPPTCNPWNLEHTPGGSSSGSAAAVATGMCLGAVGTQTGGSIVRPAAFCGIVGYKPPRKAVSRKGVYPFAPSLDHVGPMGRTVADAALLFNCMTTMEKRLLDLEGITEVSPFAPKLGVLSADFLSHAEPDMRKAWMVGIKQLRNAGAEIVEVTWPGFDLEEIWRRHRVLMSVEIAADHETRIRELPKDYSPHVAALIEEGLSVPAAEYLRCRRHQSRLRQAIIDWHLALNDDGEVYDFGPDADAIRVGATWGAILCPSAPGPAPDRSTTGNPRMNSPWSYLGLASITVPMSLAPNGLPLGMQLVSASYTEEDMIQDAVWCESVFRLEQAKPKKVRQRKTKSG